MWPWRWGWGRGGGGGGGAGAAGIARPSGFFVEVGALRPLVFLAEDRAGVQVFDMSPSTFLPGVLVALGVRGGFPFAEVWPSLFFLGVIRARSTPVATSLLSLTRTSFTLKVSSSSSFDAVDATAEPGSASSSSTSAGAVSASTVWPRGVLSSTTVWPALLGRSGVATGEGPASTSSSLSEESSIIRASTLAGDGFFLRCLAPRPPAPRCDASSSSSTSASRNEPR